eukprot:490858-Lingulodinium_polyedra.AAC.1
MRRRIWFRLEDLDYDVRNEDGALVVRKGKAHVAAYKVAGLGAEEREAIRGDEEADAYAKAGEALDANFGRSQALQGLREQ